MIKLKKLIETSLSSIAKKQHKSIIAALKELNISEDDMVAIISTVKYIEDDSWRAGASQNAYGHNDFGPKKRINSFYKSIRNILKDSNVSKSNIESIINMAMGLAADSERKGRREGFYR